MPSRESWYGGIISVGVEPSFGWFTRLFRKGKIKEWFEEARDVLEDFGRDELVPALRREMEEGDHNVFGRLSRSFRPVVDEDGDSITLYITSDQPYTVPFLRGTEGPYSGLPPVNKLGPWVEKRFGVDIGTKEGKAVLWYFRRKFAREGTEAHPVHEYAFFSLESEGRFEKLEERLKQRILISTSLRELL